MRFWARKDSNNSQIIYLLVFSYIIELSLFYFSYVVSMEDILLINAHKQGNTSCFGEIYEKYVDDIYRFVLRKVGEKETAEDLTSTIWIKILSSIDSYQEQSGATLKSWIYRIANNTVIDHYRTKKENVDMEEIVEPSLSPDFWKDLDNKDSLKHVVEYLQWFSSREQEIVFLRVWDDLSYKEISEILGESVDNCKQIYSRTIKKVQANITLILLLFLLIL